MSQAESTFINKANIIINESSTKLLYNYFNLQIEAEKYYGKNTIILMQVGDFYEIYEAEEIGKATEIAKSLNFQLTKKTKKDKNINKDNPLMCGFPLLGLEKNLNIIIELNKWTIVIVDQYKAMDNKNKEQVYRKIQKVISKGVNLEFNQNYNYNFVASLYIDKLNDIYYCGLSLIDVSIGKVMVFEGYGDNEDKNLILDEINNFLNIYPSSEIVISHSKLINNYDLDFVKKELNLEDMNYIINDTMKEEYPISYQNEILKEVYKLNSFLSPIEELDLERLPLASTSLVSLFNFIIQHNPEIIYELDLPVILEQQNKLYCGNNAIKQLNIIDDKLSIEKIINTAKTYFGKRYVKELLLNPIKDEEKIKQRFELSEKFINLDKSVVSEIKRKLNDIYDIERYERLINIKDINPKFFYNFFYSLQEINVVLKTLIKEKFYIKGKEEDKYILAKLVEMINEIEKTFDIEELSITNNVKKISNTFINSGINEDLDKLLVEKNIILNKLEAINNIFENISSDLGAKLKYTDIEGYYIEVRKSKFNIIKPFLEKELKDYKSKAFTTYIKITSEDIKTLSNEFFFLQNKIAIMTMEVYKTYITKFSFKKELSDIIKYVKKLDFCIVNYNLLNYKNCSKPIIISTENKDAFIELEGVRHLLVEEEERNGIYVDNDIFLGDSKYLTNKKLAEDFKVSDKLNGIMLHGLNASGKSTLIKSIGITIIMAQSGFFVPAKKMYFSLFDTLFTRISGADNIHKGLSTFTIEMLEMKNIFNRSNGKTLVLGDELSHGTETQSAISIVASGFLTLVELNNLFIFATHLHQLNELEEIKENKTLIPLHLHVKYDKFENKLTFDRKLRYGQGLSTYGLEYAKFLNLNQSFIKKAYEIRSKIATNKTNLELLVDKKESVYNKDLYMKQCALCSNKAIETHHIKEQHTANEFSRIDNIHKNHKYNLIPLCEEHHRKVHNGDIIINGFIMTSNGLELNFREKE